MEKTKVTYMDVDSLIPYANNPRLNDNAVDSVAASIKEFGFKVPIVVDGENVIINGHTRLKAAHKLGLKQVPVIVADDLTPEQVKAFRLADNKTSEFAEWDIVKLNIELEEIEDIKMNDFGFDIDLPELEYPTIDVDDYHDENGSDEDAHMDGSRGYSITYEIAFNDESEQAEWYAFLRELKQKYPNVGTISERILKVVRWWRDEA